MLNKSLLGKKISLHYKSINRTIEGVVSNIDLTHKQIDLIGPRIIYPIIRELPNRNMIYPIEPSLYNIIKYYNISNINTKAKPVYKFKFSNDVELLTINGIPTNSYYGLDLRKWPIQMLRLLYDVPSNTGTWTIDIFMDKITETRNRIHNTLVLKYIIDEISM